MKTHGARRLGLAWSALALAMAACGEDASEERIRAAQLSEGCLLDSDCADELVCVFQRCHVECNTSEDCAQKVAPGIRCMLGSKPANVCQLFTDCEYDSECEGNQVCGPDMQCRDQCRNDKDCVPEQQCVTGVCADTSEVEDGKLKGVTGPGGEGESCRYNSDCDGDLVCIAGECGVECVTAKDCPLGWSCSNSRCAPPGYGGGGSGGIGGSGGVGGASGSGGAAGSGGSGGSSPDHCSNRVVDGDESGEDCGGSCPPCPSGFPCADGGDCDSQVCTDLRCAPPSCYDGLHNGSETDVDCGGASCGPCGTGAECTAATDCASLACDTTTSTCVAATCMDTEKNGTETGVDCGGPECAPCAVGEGCSNDNDCAGTALCGGGTCAESYQLTVNVAGTGAGSVMDDRGKLDCPDVTCTARYPSGVTVNLAATPGTGATFTQWDGACTGTNANLCAILADADRTTTATFDGGAALEWFAPLSNEAPVQQPTHTPSGDAVELGAGAFVVSSGTRAAFPASPCGTNINGGQFLARFDAAGTCTSGSGTRILPATDRTVGLATNTAGDVIGGFRMTGTADLGQGVLTCTNYLVGGFDASTLGTKWHSPCRNITGLYGADGAAGDLVVAGAVADGDDAGGGAIATSHATEAFLGVYSGTDGTLTASAQLPGTTASFLDVKADGAGGFVAGGLCRGLWNSTAMQWDDQAQYSLCVVRYDAALTVRWIRSWAASRVNFDPRVTALALGAGAAGNEDVYFTGYFAGSMSDNSGAVSSNGYHDVVFGRLSGATGASVWLRSAGGDYHDLGLGVATDGDGDVWVGFTAVRAFLLHDGTMLGSVTPTAESTVLVQYGSDGSLKSAEEFRGNSQSGENRPFQLKEWTGGSVLMMAHNSAATIGSFGSHTGAYLLKVAP